ncbi:hypothetical protein COJ98_28515, partial [Bacillus cereus]
YHFSQEDSFLKEREVSTWEIHVSWHRPTCLLSFTCTDCSSKTEAMRLVAEKRCNRKIFNVLLPHTY